MEVHPRWNETSGNKNGSHFENNCNLGFASKIFLSSFHVGICLVLCALVFIVKLNKLRITRN